VAGWKVFVSQLPRRARQGGGFSICRFQSRLGKGNGCPRGPGREGWSSSGRARIGLGLALAILALAAGDGGQAADASWSKVDITIESLRIFLKDIGERVEERTPLGTYKVCYKAKIAIVIEVILTSPDRTVVGKGFSELFTNRAVYYIPGKEPGYITLKVCPPAIGTTVLSNYTISYSVTPPLATPPRLLIHVFKINNVEALKKTLAVISYLGSAALIFVPGGPVISALGLVGATALGMIGGNGNEYLGSIDTELILRQGGWTADFRDMDRSMSELVWGYKPIPGEQFDVRVRVDVDTFTWTDPSTKGKLKIEVRVTPQADGRYKWEYLVTNLSYNPHGGNGFSSFSFQFADYVDELSGQFGPEGWEMNYYPDGVAWDKISGLGAMPGEQVAFGFFTEPRELVKSRGMASTWVGDRRGFFFGGDLLVPGKRK